MRINPNGKSSLATVRDGCLDVVEEQANMDGELDRQQLDLLVNNHLPDAFAFALRLTGNLDRAEDLIQDTMVKVFNHWSDFRGQSQFKTWLFRIVINTFRDQQRRQQKSSKAESISVVAELIDKNQTEQLPESNELSQIIANEIAGLPPRQREVFILLTYEEFSVSDVASSLGITTANVYANLHTARSQLKKKLSFYYQFVDRDRA